MKKTVIAIMAALIATAAVPAFAVTAQEKEACAISANTCLDRAGILEKRVIRLKEKVAKGDKVYSAEEMKMLEMKLQEALDQLEKIEGHM